MSGVKKFCEVLFTHGDQNGSIGAHTVGVARARLVPGSGPFTVFDLVLGPRPGDPYAEFAPQRNIELSITREKAASAPLPQKPSFRSTRI